MQRSKEKGPIAKIIILLINERVQNELGIVRPQLKSIKESSDRLKEKSMLRIKAMQQLLDSEKPKARQSLMRELAEAADAFLAEVLRPDQLKRFQQIQLQHEGIDAFLNASVRNELSLTKEQIASLKVKAILHQGIKNPASGVREQAMQEVMSMLTEQQSAKWQEMLGEPFDFGETESQASDAPPGTVQRPLSQALQSQGPPSQPPGASHWSPSAPSTSQRGPIAPAGDPFADDNVF